MKILYLATEDLWKPRASGKVHLAALGSELVNLEHQLNFLLPKYGARSSLELPSGTNAILLPTLGKHALGLAFFELVLLFTIPWIKWRHRPDVVMVRGGGPGWIMGVIFLFFRLFRIPVVLECNGVSWEEFQRRGYSDPVVRQVRFSAWQQATTANHVIGVTSEIADAYRRLAARSPDDFHTVPNGTFPEDFTPDEAQRNQVRRELGINDSALVVGYVGSFAPWHGISAMCEAAMRLDGHEDVVFVLVGDGTGKTETESWCRANKIGNVLLPGATASRDELCRLVGAFDVGLCTYADLHGSSLKLFEFMAAGLPVIGSGFPQVIQILDHDQAGLAISATTDDELLAAIRTILADRLKWKETGRRNRITCLENYRWEHTAKKVERVLLDV